MADPKKEEKKSIFDKAVDMVSNRDEKAAAEQASKEVEALKISLSREQTLRRQWEEKAAAVQKEVETAKQALAVAQQAASGSKTVASNAEARIASAETRAKAAEARATTAEDKVRQLEEQVRKYQEMDQQRAQAEQAKQAAVQAAQMARKHKVMAGDTLSGLALKYYGSAAREKWMRIYEANKATIGENPNIIRAGTDLIIPED